MAAANAQIGVAKAAFFPSLTLMPGIGWESTHFASLLSAPSLMWTLGATVGQVLFDGGRRAANVKFASEGYQVAEATYRQTVLNAFQQVQDGITGFRCWMARRSSRMRPSTMRSICWRSPTTAIRAVWSRTSMSSPRSSRCSPASVRMCRFTASR